MKEELQIFTNKEFGSVRTLEINGKPYFCGSDIAKALGYSKPQNAISTHCKGALKQGIGVQTGKKADGTPAFQNVNMLFIPEGDVYRLIVKSKLPAAEKFESWVFDEVLPTIRKHDVYMTNEAIERTLTDPDYLIQLATTLKEERKARLLAEQKIEEQKPLVEFASKVSDSVNLIDMGKMAKLLNDEHIEIGRNRLFEWLRKNGILMSNNLPYQKYIKNGYFQVKESVFDTPCGIKTQQTTYVTGKGQLFISELLHA